jgi:hypothetical protein
MLKLSKFTVDVLKNFASINPNLVIKEGSTFSTIAEAKNIMATVQVPETFSKTFGVYDLNEFISAMGLLEDANIELLDDMAVLSTDSAKVKYRFANPSVLTTPQKEIKMPSTDIKLAITSNTLNQIRKAASVLGQSVLDPKDASANTYNIELSEKHTLNKEFSLEFLIDNLKLFSGNYNVEISSKLISQWTHAEFALTYFIALEKSSTI